MKHDTAAALRHVPPTPFHLYTQLEKNLSAPAHLTCSVHGRAGQGRSGQPASLAVQGALQRAHAAAAGMPVPDPKGRKQAGRKEGYFHVHHGMFGGYN